MLCLQECMLTKPYCHVLTIRHDVMLITVFPQLMHLSVGDINESTLRHKKRYVIQNELIALTGEQIHPKCEMQCFVTSAQTKPVINIKK